MAETPAESKVSAKLAPPELDDYFGHYGQTEVPRMAWSVAEAKAKLSSVIEQARVSPQMITRNGRPAAVVVSMEEWQRRTSRSGTLVEFLAASPLRGSGLRTERAKDLPRDVEL
jgi:prevent-host-death family protein